MQEIGGASSVTEQWWMRFSRQLAALEDNLPIGCQRRRVPVAETTTATLTKANFAGRQVL